MYLFRSVLNRIFHEFKMTSTLQPVNYSLCSETFKSNLSKGFSLLQQQQEFVDVTIATDGHFVKAHQTILALASPYFKGILQAAPSQHPIIFLCNIGHNILTYILEYVYTGEVQVPSKIFDSFVKAAQQMHILGLEHLNAVMTMGAISCDKNVQEEKQYPDSLDVMSDIGTEEEVLNLSVSLEQSGNRGIDKNLTENVFIHRHKSSINSKTECESNNSHNERTETDIEDTFRHNGSINSTTKCDLNNSQDERTEIEIEDTFRQPSDETTETSVAHFEHCELESNSNEALSKEEDLSHDDTHSQLPGTNSHIAELHDQHIAQDTTTEATPLYTMSKRKSLIMILNRYLYNLHHCSDNSRKRRWRCIEYRRKHCPAYVDTLEEKIISRVNSHFHGFHDEKILLTGSKKNIFTSLEQAIK